VPLLGLPGNPVSALVTGILFLVPALAVLSGLPAAPPPVSRAVLGADLTANDHRADHLRARLAPGLGTVDLLRAAFPPGSITGAPKVQAMKVIRELEPPGGPFFGSLLFAGVDGGFDSNVLIRTVAFERDAAGGWAFELRAGAGIVADSDPVSERRETETKASAILAALAAQPAGFFRPAAKA